jgi:hypothetical protein
VFSPFRSVLSLLTLLLYLVVVGQAPTRILCVEGDGRVQIEGIIACLQDSHVAVASDRSLAAVDQSNRAFAEDPEDCGPVCTDLPLMTDSVIAHDATVMGPPSSEQFLHPALPRPPTFTAELSTSATGHMEAFETAVGHALSQRQTVVLLC